MQPGRFPYILFTETDRQAENKETEIGWVAKTLANPAGKGKRNDTLASLAGYFALTGVGTKVASEILQMWNGKNLPPLDYSEVEQTVKSVYKTSSRKTREPEDIVTSPDGQLFSLMDFGKYMSKFHGQDSNWVIPDWLPESSITFLVSAPGGHKTWMLLDLAVSVASGCPFLGRYPVTEKGPVILIQQEDFHGQTVQRLSVITHNRLGLVNDGETIDLPPPLPIFVHADRRLKFSDKKILDSLADRVREIKPKLVILDPLYSAAETSDFMASTAEQMFILKKLRDEVGTGFVIAHHTNKSKDTNSMREEAWGSQFLNAFLETGWQLRPQNDAVKVKRHFKMFANPQEVFLKFDIDTEESYTYNVTEVEPKKEKAPKEKPVIDEVEEPINVTKVPKRGTPDDRVFNFMKANTTQGFTATQIAKEVGSGIEAVKQSLGVLVDKKWLTRDFHTYKWNTEKT